MLAKLLNPQFKLDAVITNSKPRGKWYSGTARGTPWTLFFGAMAGTAIGVLNLTAVASGWKLEESFELLDAPISSLMDAARSRFESAALRVAPIADVLDWAAIIFYWTLIGLFVTSFICLARHRNHRRVILFGAGGGILIGTLNWLAIVNHWLNLWLCFTFLDRPVKPAKEAIGSWINGHFLRISIPDLIPYVALTYVVYWLAVGVFLAFIFCVIRMFVKRMTATGTQVAEK